MLLYYHKSASSLPLTSIEKSHLPKVELSSRLRIMCLYFRIYWRDAGSFSKLGFAECKRPNPLTSPSIENADVLILWLNCRVASDTDYFSFGRPGLFFSYRYNAAIQSRPSRIWSFADGLPALVEYVSGVCECIKARGEPPMCDHWRWYGLSLHLVYPTTSAPGYLRK